MHLKIGGGESVIFTVDKPITWNFGVVASSFGYNKVYDRSFWTLDEEVGNPPKLSDGSFFRQSAERLPEIWKTGVPTMLTLVSYSGHNPFKLPDNLKDPDFDLSKLGLHPTLENFATMAHYTDSQLPTIINYLRSRDDWSNTLVVITGDHEGLAGQREDIRKSSPLAAEIVDSRQMTPFIVLNSPLPGHVEKVIGQVDMYPTILSLLGMQDYEWQGVGQNLFSPASVPAAISSMTRQVEGDTTGVEPTRLRHWQQAREISDLIIRNDYFKNFVAR